MPRGDWLDSGQTGSCRKEETTAEAAGGLYVEQERQ
jgi:hypothetical protein